MESPSPNPTGDPGRQTGRTDPMLERIIGSYRLVRKIGQGGMGAVYEAQHTSDGSRAAVKVLLRHSLEDPNAARRFFNEAKAISMVSHPSLVKIFEYGNCPTDDGSEGEAYIVMEYLDGETLRARLAKRYVGQTCLRLMRQIASALSATHKRRIVHRDLKPDNIMLVADPTVAGGERVKILDFGIAKLLPEAGSPEAAGDGNTLPEPAVPGMVRTVKTRTGMPIGTPAYMSPEQCRASAPPDEKTDVYSVAIIFYEMLYGEPPFHSDSAGEMYALQMFGTPPELASRAPGVNAQLAALIHRMLDKKPAARPSMDELLKEVEGLSSTGLQDGPVEMRPSERRLVSAADQAISSGVIRAQVDERVRATDKLALINAAAPGLQTTGTGSLGEQVAVSRYSRRGLGAIIGMGLVLLGVAGSILWLKRPAPVVPVATPVSAAPVPAPSPATPPPAIAGKAEPEAAGADATAKGEDSAGKTAGKESGKSRPSSKAGRRDKPTRKPAHSAKKDKGKVKIDLWK